jgi:hypothetical protein
MSHADELLLAREPLDPATELFVEDHLRGCARCRDLQRKVERADRLIAASEAPTMVPPRRAEAAPTVGRSAIALLVVGVIIVGGIAGAAIRTLRGPDGRSQVATGQPAPSLPSDWQLVTLHDLLIPLPPGWQKTIDEIGKPTTSDSPRIIYFEGPRLDGASNARSVSVWVWPGRSMDDLVQKRFIDGNLSFLRQGSVASWRPVRETVGVASWSDARGSGSYLARNLFVQVDAERVVMVGVTGPTVPSQRSEPTPDLRTIQETIVTHVVALPDTSATFTADQARMAIERRMPIEKVPMTEERPSAIPPVVYAMKAGTGVLIRVYVHPSAAAARAAPDPSSASGGSPAGPNASVRAIGNLTVWVTSADANVRYTVLTALDGLLDPKVAASPAAGVPAAGYRNGSCTIGPLTESGRNGDFVFRWTDIDEGNEFLIVEKRGAAIGDRIFATFSRLDAPGQIGYPEVIAQPFGSGPPVFRIGMYKPAGPGCWRVDLRDTSDSHVVASYVIGITDLRGACPRTRSTDASGVITSNGLIGIAGTTLGTSADVNGTFGWLVRAGATPGQSVGVVFRQIGASAPASSVSFSIPAVPRQSAWGDVAFDMHWKPMGFANSCWRLFVDGADSGIVLFVGP